MRFQKAELAFFIFILRLFAAGGVVLIAYLLLDGMAPAGAAEVLGRLGRIQQLMFAAGSLIAAAVLFGVLFIFPQIRSQAKEHGKLREMTQTLGTVGATHVRFLYGLPFGILFCALISPSQTSPAP